MTARCPYAALYEPDFHTDPHAVYEQMRRDHGPVIPTLIEPGVEGWLVIDYATITAWCRDTETFSRDSRYWRDWREGRISDDAAVLPMMVHRPNVFFADGEEHQRLRRAITDSLGRFSQSTVATESRNAADQLIDAFCEKGEVELLNDYARLLPLLLVTRMFGLDNASGQRLITALRSMWDGIDAERANAEYERVLSETITAKRRKPGEDVTSWLMQHRAGLSDEELLQQLVIIIGAGVEPAANLIANGIRTMLTDRGLGGDVAGARISIEDAISQVLWVDPPVTNYPILYPKRDVPLSNGTAIRKGTPVLLGYAAANRFVADEHSDAMGRTANRAHLAWGVGPHRCPAQDAGTTIAATGIETLINRLSGLRLAVPPEKLEWRVSPFSRALTGLPIAFTPQQPPSPPTAEGTQWSTPSSPSSPETTTAKPNGSAGSGRSSLSNFLAKLMRGR